MRPIIRVAAWATIRVTAWATITTLMPIVWDVSRIDPR
jgi:hypothetical protein